MSDTTPRPDETPTDPTSAPPPPPPVPPVTNAADPAYGPFYTQQGYAPPQAAQQPGVGQEPPVHARAAPSQGQAYPVPYGAPPGREVAPMNPSDERTWGMVSHLIPLAALVLSAGALSFVASLVTYLVVRDRGPFVRHHAANALNVQIIAGIVMLVSLPLMFVLIGFVTFAAAWVFAVVVHVIGAVKANNGEWYQPALTPQFVK
jgi:uncharacterized protein